MTTYRFLWLDENGYTPKSAQVECRTDRQAIDIAERQTGDYDTIEVWEGSRFICHCENPDRKEVDGFVAALHLPSQRKTAQGLSD